MTQQMDSLRVFLRDCRVELPIGVHASEMQGPQPVLINVEMEAASPPRYLDPHDRNLDHVIDYETLYAFITREIPQMGHIYLLESIAEQIAAFCFRDARVRTARVRVEKTAIFAAAAGAGVEIVRTRSAS